MKIGLIGIGRMGLTLVKLLHKQYSLYVFDTNSEVTTSVASKYSVQAVSTLHDFQQMAAVILAVPDTCVMNCIEKLKDNNIQGGIISIATNISQKNIQKVCGNEQNCICVKFVGQADEMAVGEKPVIVIDEGNPQLIDVAEKIFGNIGEIIVGNSDIVQVINGIVARQAIEAAVGIENELIRHGYTQTNIRRAALRLVAAGIIKAYSDGNLGPYANAIVEEMRESFSCQGKAGRNTKRRRDY